MTGCNGVSGGVEVMLLVFYLYLGIRYKWVVIFTLSRFSPADRTSDMGYVSQVRLWATEPFGRDEVEETTYHSRG